MVLVERSGNIFLSPLELYVSLNLGRLSVQVDVPNFYGLAFHKETYAGTRSRGIEIAPTKPPT